jgi:hypothetical protein
MIVNRALRAAAVLLFTAPAAPALTHDDYGDHVEHWRLHRDLSEAHYVRCLAIGPCPGNWHDHDGWRRYYDDWPYGDWRYGGWRYGGWPYGGRRYGGWRYGGWGY